MTPTKRLLAIVGVICGTYALAGGVVLLLDWLLPWD